MINTDRLKAVIDAYKEYFPNHWKDEKFKWEAVKHFHDHWDINAQDFTSMLEIATDKTFNLLAASYFYPRKMVLNFANADTEATRSMFINLLDETKDLAERVEQFQFDAEKMRSEHNDGTWNNHYQNTNAISTYLWLRYPDKYYIYKYSECRAVAKELESDFVPKRSSSAENMIGGYKLFDTICEYLQTDPEIISMLKSHLTDNCYPDNALRTMTNDVEYFISRFYTKKGNVVHSGWFPADYSPNLTIENWVNLLEDSEVFTISSLEIMKRMQDIGGMATCKELSNKYGETSNFYNTGSSALARRIARKTGCPVMLNDTENAKWWPILYVGKYANKNTPGIYMWKLRDELSEALDQVDLSNIALYADETPAVRSYWWLNANPKIWSFSNIEVGHVENYTLYNDNGNKRRIFQNFLDAKAGDLVIGYESNPVKQVVALAKVAQEQDGENLYFEKTESLSTPIDYFDLKSCPELKGMEFFTNPQGSLFKLTKEEYDFIMDMVREENPISQPIDSMKKYTREDFLSEVYMSGEDFDFLIALLEHKKNLILQGAPGVGKTFTAKRLAYAKTGMQDDSRIELIQFHQNYSYEDFIMGYKPVDEGFKLTSGIFYQFCQKAANHPEDDYFFIIDEINRGNMSKIFGELLMLVESDYRGTKATLAYSGTPFSVPKNLYLIGMMNTADRSLAMIDYALRRRFSFFDMVPGFESDGFKAYQTEINNETFNSVIDCIRKLNIDIARNSSLGKGFCIGHSYFCGQTECTEEWLKQVVYFEIIPMLREYWFDEPEKLQPWENELSGIFND